MRRLITKSRFLIMMVATLFVVVGGPALACSDNSRVSETALVDHVSLLLNQADLTHVKQGRTSEQSLSSSKNNLPADTGVHHLKKNSDTNFAMSTRSTHQCCRGNKCAACLGCCGVNGMCASSCAATSSSALSPAHSFPFTLERSTRTCLYSDFKVHGHDVEPGLRPPRA